MQLNLCPLFSGSSGNSVYMACGGVKLLVDAGMSAARVEANLREIGVDIRNIDAILVTHEHIDHVRGLGVLCRRYGMPVYANEGTWQGILQKETGIPAKKCMRTFLHRGGFLYRRAQRPSVPRFRTTRPIPSGSPLTVRGCAAAWRRTSGTSARRGCARFPAVRRWCWRPITMWTWFAAGRIPSGSSSGFSARGAPQQRGLRPCAVRAGGKRNAPSFFLTFLLTIIYLNWHIIRYAARFRRRASTWKTISRVCVSRRDRVSDLLTLQTDEADAM